MHTSFDAIIIGAGPAGSTAAIRLAQAGWSVALIEKQRFPRRKVCGECLAASNLSLLDALGIGKEFHALAGSELKRVVLMHGAGSVCADLPAYAAGPHAWGKALGREHLDVLLLQRAVEVGATVLQPWAIRDVQGQAGAYECIAYALESKATLHLHAPVVIAAHGSWEPGMAAAQRRQTKAGDSDLFAFKANFTQSALQEGMLPVLSFRGGYGGMVLGEHGMLTLACCIRRDRLTMLRQQARELSAGEAVQSYLMAECRGVREALQGATRRGRWLSIGPIHPGIRMPRDGGRFFLVGNAAGEAHPIIGEGMSMALQAAWLLSDYLINEPHLGRNAQLHKRIMQDYARAWRTHFAPRIHLAALFAGAAMQPSLAHMLLPVLKAWPGSLTCAARLSGKVSRPRIRSRPMPRENNPGGLKTKAFTD